MFLNYGYLKYVLFWQTVFHPDITIMVDWALKINCLSIYLVAKCGKIPTVVWLVRKILPWRFEPLLWPWPWGQQSKVDKIHSSSWWCTTIPCWLQKVQKLRWYGRNFFFKDIRPQCGLDLEFRNLNFVHCNTQGHDDKPIYTKFHCRRLKGFRSYQEKKYSLRIWTITVTVTLKTAIQNCYTHPRRWGYRL